MTVELTASQGLKVIEQLQNPNNTSQSFYVCTNDCTDPECRCFKKRIKLSSYRVDSKKSPLLSLLHDGRTCAFKNCKEANEFVEGKISNIKEKHPRLFNFPDVTNDLVDWMEVNTLIAGIQTKLEADVYFWKNDDRAQDLIANFLFKDTVPDINMKRRGHSSVEGSNVISTATAAISIMEEGSNVISTPTAAISFTVEDDVKNDTENATNRRLSQTCDIYMKRIYNITLAQFVTEVLANGTLQQQLLGAIIVNGDIMMLQLLSIITDDGNGNNISLLTTQMISSIVDDDTEDTQLFRYGVLRQLEKCAETNEGDAKGKAILDFIRNTCNKH